MLLPCLFLLGLCGCSARPAGLFPPANLEISAEVEISEAPSPGGAKDMLSAPSSSDRLIVPSYPWGSSFDMVLDAETEEGQLPGTDYGYFEDADPYARELVFRSERDGHVWHCYYDFDSEDRLVSSMLMLRDNLSAREAFDLFLTCAEAFSSQYGPELRGFLSSGGTPEDTVEALLSTAEELGEPVLGEWRDAEGNQLLLEFRIRSSGSRPELYITRTASAWAADPF